MTDSPSPEDTTRDKEGWANALNEAFRTRQSHPLQLAEQATRAYPRDGYILDLAAIAALLEEKPERCLRYLKRWEKYYVVDKCHHLLRALALAQQGQIAPAAEILRHHGLDSYSNAFYWFPGDVSLRPWLREWVGRIVNQQARRIIQSAQKKKTPKKSRVGKPAVPPKAVRSETPSTSPTAEPESTTPELPRFQAHIPVHFELTNQDAISLEGQNRDEKAGIWFRLRTEFSHLGLLQGFDELLCLPQLHQIETFWYQLETVRKVLKQFRGRVLLADEVGLGKTVEAGMILKEYLLRGMLEKFLILTPASLVGQWREELETKFDITCATSYDALLKSDPEAFWDQPRVIASIATARRKEHFARLTEQTYDLVAVDEAHHLKNRSTQNYKLVDALKKRFLLLLSATPVQNSLVELYNLLTLLKPGIFQTEKEFRAAYMTAGSRQPRSDARSHAGCDDTKHPRAG